jgi:phenylpyruvate tautomerase PptA (4-oxalocrotonate tautomerase family)
MRSRQDRAHSLAGRTWVLITEAPEGGWGIGGHANTQADIAAARAAIADQ